MRESLLGCVVLWLSRLGIWTAWIRHGRHPFFSDVLQILIYGALAAYFQAVEASLYFMGYSQCETNLNHVLVF